MLCLLANLLACCQLAALAVAQECALATSISARALLPSSPAAAAAAAGGSGADEAGASTLTTALAAAVRGAAALRRVQVRACFRVCVFVCVRACVLAHPPPSFTFLGGWFLA